jgi:hypothetical protein
MELFVLAGEFTPAFTCDFRHFIYLDGHLLNKSVCCTSYNSKIKSAGYAHSSSTEASVYVAQPSPVFACSAILLTCIGGLTRLRAESSGLFPNTRSESLEARWWR